ncbi:MAG: putative inorganic carbon transporter subunit DabA, partial [Nitrospiraceae bacterium]
MTAPDPQKFTDAQRMELRSYVELAGEVISQYWPMRTFIHHNPLHGLESLPFGQAVQRGAFLFGGRGYLDNDTFRSYVKMGRIGTEDLRTALEPLAIDKAVAFAGRTISHLDVLCASMIHGITEPRPHGRHAVHDDNASAWRSIAPWLQTTVGIQDMVSRAPLTSWPSLELPSRETLGTWCDRTVGTPIVETINREMVKWCSVFLDEGEASWSMPHRDQTFYRAWKSVVQHDMT